MLGPPPPDTQLSLQLEATAKLKKVFLVRATLALVAVGTAGAVWGLTRLAAAGAIGIVALVLAVRGRHDRLSGVAFILMYLAFYVILLVL
jgi:hypothetical protein